MPKDPHLLLTLGECMVELSPHADDFYRMGFAGDAFNTAWYARRVLPDSWVVGFATALGTDALSDRMMAFFADEGLDTSAIRRVQDRTPGLYMIQLDNGERSFAYWRGQSAARALADDAAWLEDTLGRADMVLLSGITLAILTPEARKHLIAALSAIRKQGTRVAFDTNLRRRLWPNDDEMRACVSECARVADIVFPSFDEEQDLFGDETPEETIGRYRAAGADLVVVKNGTNPLSLWSRNSGTASFQPTPVTEVVDTTAAGDSFNAGFLGVYLTEGTLAEAAEAGMALSARVVQGKGALVREAV